MQHKLEHIICCYQELISLTLVATVQTSIINQLQIVLMSVHQMIMSVCLNRICCNATYPLQVMISTLKFLSVFSIDT